MRIPEYRGFIKDLTIRPQWISGSHIYDNSSPNNPKHYIRKSNDENPYRIIPETLQQFTGCFDSRGTKVFEGDILHVDGALGDRKVVWDTAKKGFDVCPPCPDQFTGDYGYVQFFQLAQNIGMDYHVVGNYVQVVEEVFPSETERRIKRK